MFKFLKEKLKGTISKFSKKVEEETKAEVSLKEEKILEEKKIEEEIKVPVEAKKTEEQKEIKSQPEIKEESEKPKQGLFSRLKEKVSTTKLSYGKFETLFSELELALMENNVALEVIEKIKLDLGKKLVESPIKRTKIEETIKDSLKNSIEELKGNIEFKKQIMDDLHKNTMPFLTTNKEERK